MSAEPISATVTAGVAAGTKRRALFNLAKSVLV